MFENFASITNVLLIPNCTRQRMITYTHTEIIKMRKLSYVLFHHLMNNMSLLQYGHSDIVFCPARNIQDG